MMTVLRLVYEGIQRKIEGLDPTLGTAVSIPFVFGLVVFVFRQRAKRLDQAGK
jgi:hypothetical protein